MTSEATDVGTACGAFIVGMFLLPFLLMLLWNAFMPGLFGVPTIEYWEAFALRAVGVLLTH